MALLAQTEMFAPTGPVDWRAQCECWRAFAGHLMAHIGELTAMLRGVAPPMPSFGVEPAANEAPPPIRATQPVASARLARIREQEAERQRRRRAQKKAEREAQGDDRHADSPPAVTRTGPPDGPRDSHADSRAVFSSSSLVTTEEEKKNTTSLLVMEGGRTVDRHADSPPAVTRTGPPDADVQRTPTTPCLAERLVAAFAAARGGARLAMPWKQQCALRELLSATYANGDEAEIERRWAIGLARPTEWRRPANLTDLLRWWDDCAQAPPPKPKSTWEKVQEDRQRRAPVKSNEVEWDADTLAAAYADWPQVEAGEGVPNAS
jgi:hypothetical protein